MKSINFLRIEWLTPCELPRYQLHSKMLLTFWAMKSENLGKIPVILLWQMCVSLSSIKTHLITKSSEQFVDSPIDLFTFKRLFLQNPLLLQPRFALSCTFELSLFRNGLWVLTSWKGSADKYLGEKLLSKQLLNAILVQIVSQKRS